MSNFLNLNSAHPELEQKNRKSLLGYNWSQKSVGDKGYDEAEILLGNEWTNVIDSMTMNFEVFFLSTPLYIEVIKFPCKINNHYTVS